jgi:uncharacterized membrane protein YuzA (DUF378 family)
MLNTGLYTISLITVLFGGLNWLLIGAFGFNLIKYIISKINPARNNINKYCYLIIGLCALYLIIFQSRHMFLSFLDETVMPPSVFFSQASIFHNTKMKINAQNGLKVIYWAANPVKKDYDNINNWRDAYDGYKNVGVADVVDDEAELLFSIPVRYRVGLFNKLLDRHIHYRIVYPSGVIGKVETIKLNNDLDKELLN